jgi:hypothetical protein
MSKIRSQKINTGRLAWTACALREVRTAEAQRFWDALERFGLTEHPIERRALARELASAFAREYARVGGKKEAS